MKISRKNHTASLEKWGGKLKEQIAKRTPWDNNHGWDGNRIWIECGYCEEVNEKCKDCSLYPEICGIDNNSLFMQFSECYFDHDLFKIKPRPAYKRSEKLRQRIYKAILKDEKNVYKEN